MHFLQISKKANMNKHGGMGRGPGRKTLAENGEVMKSRPIRMTDDVWEKCKRLGGSAWVRNEIEKAGVPVKGKPAAKTNIENFAKKAGVEIIECDKKWGGTIGYKTKDYPNSAVCGFLTERAAYRHWMENALGKNVANTIIDLLGLY